MMDFADLITKCAAEVHPQTMQRIVHVESGFNPYAIGVVGAQLERQPRNLDEAVNTAAALEKDGYDYSVGLAQINRTNFARFGLTHETGFDACANLRAGAAILKECFERAAKTRSEQAALQAALSCYYSGNFRTGFEHGYVARVVGAGESPGSFKAATAVMPRPDTKAPVRAAAATIKPAQSSETRTRALTSGLGEPAARQHSAAGSALLF